MNVLHLKTLVVFLNHDFEQVYLFPYTKKKSKELDCRRYVFKLFFFLPHPFSMSFLYFLVREKILLFFWWFASFWSFFLHF